MSDCAQFEAAAQALMVLSSKAAQPLLPCFERMLADSVLRKVLKEDADQGCGVLIAVLVGLGREKVALSQKLQESVSKVRDALGAGAGAGAGAALAQVQAQWQGRAHGVGGKQSSARQQRARAAATAFGASLPLLATC